MTMSSNVMRETFKLPKLPGNSFQEEMMRGTFKKRQVMQPLTGPKTMDVDRIPVDFEALHIAPTTGEEPTGDQSISLDKKVLRFSAYFKEGIHESRLESDRVRRCMLYYFLEDDTISVSEPREDNAGMSQGCMLKRHAIQRPDGSGNYSFEDFNIGSAIVFYGKSFVICDCDQFTRNFLTGLGIDVAEAVPFPKDTYQTNRARPERKPRDIEDRHLVAVMECNYSGKRSRLSPEELQAAKKFLKNDRKVLKFKAAWNDSNALYGDDRRFTLYYFLADDTIEVTEDLPVNAGRDPFPSFVRRRRCAKPTGKYDNPKASLSFRNDPQDYYTDADLYIGADIEVFGRKFKLLSNDDFTQKYLQDHHGRTPVPPIVRDQAVKEKPKPVPPPYNGFGDEDDSLGSWKHLVLKPPKKNVKQYIENSGSMLKYGMKMDSQDPANEVRRFVLTYYLADDTVSIFEPAQRNSGIIGGKFLQRMKARRSDTGEYLKASDLYIGSTIEVNNHKFTLYATDEKSLTHMEQNSQDYVHSRINTIMAKLRCMLLSNRLDLESKIKQCDLDADGGVDYKEMAELFKVLGLPLSEHEILTVLRYIDANRDGSVTYAELLHKALPEGGSGSVDLPWEKILQESESGAKWESTLQTLEGSQHDEHTANMAAHAAKFLIDAYNSRRTLFNNAFRNEAEHSPDGKLGAAEFANVVNRRLKLNFDTAQLSCLTTRIFPRTLPRIDPTEMLRIVQGTSLHHATVPSIAAYKLK